MVLLRQLLTCLLLLTAVSATAVAADAQREDQLKAAYLFNFVKFVEWPAAGDQPLSMCFIGGDRVRAALAAGIENKRVGARPLVLRKLPDAQAATGCNVLYLAAASTASPALVPAQAMLTVSDADAFASHGGMIELFTESNRLRFRINVDNAQRAGLRISSNLLQLAADVKRAGAP